MRHASHAVRNGSAPILVIGMHRSGTRLLIALLQDLGLFIGARVDANKEAPLFVSLNDWLLRQSGATWESPEAVRHLLDNPAARAAAAGHLRHTLTTPRVASYLGWRAYLRHGTPANLEVAWGWKDPRATYTLPVWLDLFPDARVIHIYRHGVDVAQSVTTRAQRVHARATARRAQFGRAYGLWAREDPFVVDCMSLERGFGLWEAYVTQARAHVRALGEQACEVQYEDVLAAPEQALRALAAFCRLPASASAIRRAAQQVRPEHAYAYRARPDLRRFAERVAPRLDKLGYPPRAGRDATVRPAWAAR
jgi:hypothetical protein